MFGVLLRWAKHRHPNLNSYQIVSRYWRVNQGDGWRFQTRDGLKLCSHPEIPIRRHTKVKANRSPFDGDWLYWEIRFRAYLLLAPQSAAILKRQSGKCSYCGLHFCLEDRIGHHHRDGNHANSSLSNLVLLHRHCHDQVHAAETQSCTGTPDTEPC